MITLIDIIAIAIALLQFLSQQPFVPPEVMEILVLLVGILALIKDYLQKHLPQNLKWIAR